MWNPHGGSSFYHRTHLQLLLKADVEQELATFEVLPQLEVGERLLRELLLRLRDAYLAKLVDELPKSLDAPLDLNPQSDGVSHWKKWQVHRSTHTPQLEFDLVAHYFRLLLFIAAGRI